MTATVSRVQAWEALDSRGDPTPACRMWLSDGSTAAAIVPAGASTGTHEAVERRDGGERLGGKGVRAAVETINTVIADAVGGVTCDDVDRVLAELDRSPGYTDLGANSLLAVSLAAQLAAASSAGVGLARYLHGADGPLELPMPMVNIVSGGAHAGGLIDIQDVLVVPFGATSFSEAIEWAGEVRRAARAAAAAEFREATLVADEGGLGLPLTSNRAALALVADAIATVGLDGRAGIAIDVAANELLAGDGYALHSEGRELTARALVDELVAWGNDYPIVSIEDAVAEDDVDGWSYATERLGHLQLVGDDLFATNLDRLEAGLGRGIANAVLVKVNQNGLVTGAREVHDLGRRNGYRTVTSARSGETEDAWLADLATGWHSGQIKVGSTMRSERTAKWNRLLELEALEDTVLAHPFD